MKMNKYILLLLVSAIVFGACKKREFDAPPIKDIPVGNQLTIQELMDMYQGSPLKFEDDYSVFATVTMDDRNGNIYRNAYVQDESNAIVLRTNFPGGLYQGDSVRIYLKGTVLNIFNGIFQIDSVDVDKNIIKQATQRFVEPENVSLLDLINGNYNGKLVKVNDVEFAASEIGQTYSNVNTQQTLNRTLIDCDENPMIVRTSGYADFGGELVAQGHGSLVAIANEFNGTKQLLIRKIEEVNMSGDRCTGGPSNAYLVKDFSDQSIASGGWKTFQVESNPGNHNWQTSNQGGGGNYYGVATGWTGSSASETELWLVSPAVDLTVSTAPQLQFRSSTNFNGPQLKLFVSEDYDGNSDPSTQGTWIDYSGFVSWSPGTFTWTNSGIIPLLAFTNSTNFHLAYKYTSNSSAAATWQVDDIIIDEN